jgi:ankyrin repeat protein
MGEYRPMGSRFQDCCRTTRDGGGLPEGPGIPPGITHDLVLQFDLPARRMEREERLLAMHGGDLNDTLWDICEEGGRKDARFLLANGADANHYGIEDGLVIWRAACAGHLAVVEALLDAGAGAGAGALEYALLRVAELGHTAIAALLLDRGADVHYDGDAALYCAASNGHLQAATLLLDRGADPNISPAGAGTATLKTARDRGHYEMASLLLARGAIDDAA